MRGSSALNTGIRGLARGFLILFLALLGYVGYLQTVGSSAIATREENARSSLEESQAPRGQIVAAGGEVLARSVPAGTSRSGRQLYERHYPEGRSTAHIVGYISKKYGRTGIEAAENTTLSGIGGGRFFDRLLRAATNTQERGRDIQLTIDLELQKEARRVLAGRNGSIVVVNPSTGAILAAYSNPTYDPTGIDSAFPSLSKKEDSPLLNRATQGLYPPGSTMKVITAAAALSSGTTQISEHFEGPSALVVEGNKVTNYRDQTCGDFDLLTAFAKSCNTIFAKLGLSVGGEEMSDTAAEFGFGRRPSIEIPASASRYPDPEKMARVDLAWSAVGQADVLATPLQMALVAAAVANDGVVPAAHLIQNDIDINRIRGNRVVSEVVAGDLQIMMEAVVESGTGRAAARRDITIAGKTGTAEVAKGRSHAWFIGYAPAENPTAAIAVLVEHGGTGGSVAAPLAARLLAKAAAKR